MKDNSSFNFTGRLRSIRYAARGIRIMLLTQHNAWVHACATVLVVLAGFVFGLSRAEWIWIVIATAGVWTAEALNTSFELLCDVASPEFHPLVEKSKDVAAGAVLLSAIAAVVIGVLTFFPKIQSWIGF